MLLDLARLLLALPDVELHRRRSTPAKALADLRHRGMTGRHRTERERRRLRWMIGWADRFFPGGGNCYRRVLWQVALDPQAARQPVIFGVERGDGARSLSGHAWLSATDEGDGDRFEARFSL